jgi:hypothetical protein
VTHHVKIESARVDVVRRCEKGTSLDQLNGKAALQRFTYLRRFCGADGRQTLSDTDVAC